MTTFSPDLPELRLFAQLSGVAPSRMAAAFNDPERFFDHLTLAELERLKESSDRLNALSAQMAEAATTAGAALAQTDRKEL